MAQLLGNVAVGSTVYLNESGSPQPYLVVNQGNPSTELYDSSCNGTWLLRQNCKTRINFGNDSDNLTPHFATLRSNYYNNYDSNIQSIIKTVKIPYTVWGVGTSHTYTLSNGYSTSIFDLSAFEMGSVSTDYLKDGSKLQYFTEGTTSSANSLRKASRDSGAAVEYWLRTPYTLDYECYVNTSGAITNDNTTGTRYTRPCIIVNPNVFVDDSNNLTSITVPGVSSITVPSIAMQNENIPISWSSVSVSGYDVTYQLQRNVNSGGWENVVSSISQTSYTDAAQSGWNTVRYRVAAQVPSVTGAIGSYKTSSTIPVRDSNNLVISGQDGDLGTVTANIPYTVSSNTGNPISLTRKVNQVNVANVNIDSGFAYNIPIFDLPTGTNTIQLTAQVQAPSGQVNETRTWTYTKTPMQFPDTGGVAQLVQNGQNIWPLTLAESVRVPTYFGGSLDKALELLSTNTDFAVIAVGEYTGTGTYGQNSPNTLTFSSMPLMVLIYSENNTLIISSTNTLSTAYIQGTQAKWYSTISAEDQMNISGTIYSYIAIG